MRRAAGHEGGLGARFRRIRSIGLPSSRTLMGLGLRQATVRSLQSEVASPSGGEGVVSRSQVLRGGCGWRPFERAIGVLSLAVTPCLHPCATGTGSGLGTTDPAAMHPSACTAGTRLRVASHGLLAGGVRSCWGCVWPVNAAQCCHRRTGSRPSAATRAGRAGPVSPPARRLRSTNPESGSGSPLACLSRVPPVPKSWGGGGEAGRASTHPQARTCRVPVDADRIDCD